MLEDRRLLTVELVSVTPGLSAGALTSTNPAISAGGRYVAFQSRATDLVAGFSDTNGGEDVFVRDLMLDTTVLISRVGARAGDGKSFDPDISDSGRFVTFASFATDLVPGTVDDNGRPDVFVHDRDRDADGVFDEPGATRTALLSVSLDGTSGTGASGAGAFGAAPADRPRISGDGRFVTFGTLATDLALIDPTPDDGPLIQFNGVDADVIKARVADGALDLVSINFMLTGTGVGPAGAGASSPSISRDGSRVAFESRATTLVKPLFFDDSPPFPPAQVYVGAGSSGVELVSVTPDGMEIGDGASREPVISRDGRHVAFISKATDLVARATNTNGFAEDVFVRDLRAAKTTLVSRSRAVPGPITTGDGASPGVAGSGAKFIGGPAISDTGRFIAFRSDATNLLDPALGVADTNGLPDIFVFDRDADVDGVFDEVGATTTVLVSINSAGTDSAASPGGPCSSFAPSLSGDGRLVAFNSTCDDLIPGVTGSNVYVRDLVTGTTTLISATTSGAGGGVGTAAGVPREVVISNSGTRVAFISDTDATDLDPIVVADAILGTDVFAGTPPPDIRVSSFLAGGLTSGFAAVTTQFETVGPIPIGIYRSADSVFDVGDELLDTTTFVPGAGLSSGATSLVSLFLSYKIGDAADELMFPGAGATESDDDYFVLLVADPLDAISEFDSDPFAEDNTGFFSVAYHEPGGPVFIHGREKTTAKERENADKIITAATATDLTVTFTGAISRTLKYPLADITGLRVRTHSGDDTVVGSPLPDFIHGGDGDDRLDGGAGDDMIYGGPGDDTLTGGAGADTFFDGCGDDTVSDLDPASGDTYMVTPCSDDVFTDSGGSDTLDFSLAARAITVNLWSQAIQTVDATGSTLRLNGQWENFVGSPFGDTVSVRPLPVAQKLIGGNGLGDRLIFDALGLNVTFDGTKFMIPGFGDVTVSGFEEIQTINAAPRIIDDSDPAPAFSAPGFFASDPQFQQGFNGGVRFSGANSGNTATWQFTNLAPGRYAVAATWTFAPDRAQNSPFTIRDGGPTGPLAASLAVNQEQNPGEFDPPEDGQNILFRNLAVVIVTGHELTVQLSDNADQFVSADAIRINTLDAIYTSNSTSTLLPDSIIDDGEIGFSSLCAADVLEDNAANRGAFGDRHRCTLPTDVTTWDFGSVPPGKYLLETTWTPDPLNPASADYEIHVGPDVFNFNVNQQQAPNGVVAGNIPWQVLGQVEVDPLDVLEALLNGEGVADAVRLRPASDLEVRTTSLTGQGQLCMKGCIITLNHNAPDRRVFSKLEVQNTGSAELNLEPVMVTGTGFSVETGFGATSLPPGASTEFEIAFDPTGLGMFSGDVVFGNDAFGLNPFDFSIDVNVVADTTPPTVMLVEPPDGAAVIEGTLLPVRADAMDDLGLQRVEFLVNGQSVATDTESPFATEIQVPTGVTQVTLGARAVDQAGNTGDSLPVVLDVLPDQPPVISCSPPSGSFFAVGPTTVTCTATDDVLVERVEFLVNSQVFQTVTEEPYVAQFDVPPGVNPFVLQARAIDSGGRIDLVDITLSVFATPIMTNTSIVVGPNDFSTNDSEVAGEPLVQPVRVFDGLDQTERFRFFPYGGSFTGGVRVATGDVNGDRVPDIITGAGTGGSGGHVKVFSGVDGSELRSFFAFPGFTGGVNVASGDVNNDGFGDIITGAGAGGNGGPVKVFSGQTNAELNSFLAFPGFMGGVTVAAGDFNRDGFDDVIVGAGPGATGGHVKVFSGQTNAELNSFLAFPGFLGGVTVAGGDVNSDGFGDIVVGGGLGATGGHVKVFDGLTSGELQSFFAYPGFTGGVQVATGDFNNDGTPDIITGPGPGAGPHVKAFDGLTLAALDSFFAYDTGFTGGIFVSGVASPPVTVIPLPAGGGVFEVIDDNDDVVVRRQGGGEVFRGPHSENPRLRINGPPNVNDVLIVNLNGLTTSITFDGGAGGNDALRLDGTVSRPFLKHQFLGPADGLVILDPGVELSVVKFLHMTYLGLEPIEDNVAVVDRVFTFPDTDDNILLNTGDSTTDAILRIDSNNSEVVDFQQPTGSLTIESATNDTANIGLGWVFDDTEVADGKFVRIFARDGLTLRMIGPRDWSNPVNPLDVNANGSVEPLDVLIIINELNAPKFRDAAGRLLDAASLPLFPDFYFDTNQDGFLVPLDALVIINFLNSFNSGLEGEETSLAPSSPFDPAFADLTAFVSRTESRPNVVTTVSRNEGTAPIARPALPTLPQSSPAPRQLTSVEYARGLDELLADLNADTLLDELLPSRS